MLFIHKIQWNKREKDLNIIQTANTIKKSILMLILLLSVENEIEVRNLNNSHNGNKKQQL